MEIAKNMYVGFDSKELFDAIPDSVWSEVTEGLYAQLSKKTGISIDHLTELEASDFNDGLMYFTVDDKSPIVIGKK